MTQFIQRYKTDKARFRNNLVHVSYVSGRRKAKHKFSCIFDTTQVLAEFVE